MRQSGSAPPCEPPFDFEFKHASNVVILLQFLPDYTWMRRRTYWLRY